VLVAKVPRTTIQSRFAAFGRVATAEMGAHANFGTKDQLASVSARADLFQMDELAEMNEGP